jgi:hypothetical protein
MAPPAISGWFAPRNGKRGGRTCRHARGPTTIRCVRGIKCQWCNSRRPRVRALEITAGRGVVPFGLCRQESAVPRAKRYRLVPCNAVHREILIIPGCIGPRQQKIRSRAVRLERRHELNCACCELRIPAYISPTSRKTRVCAGILCWRAHLCSHSRFKKRAKSTHSHFVLV